ncbi:MAG: response regulator transcription factor [Terriglobia bacterium]
MKTSAAHPPRILLVEDESGLVLTLTDLLESEGYDVESARDGVKGFEMAHSTPFDLIILDVMLPGKNGFDLCRDLRERGIRTPVLMLTARSQTLDKVLGLNLGADDYVTKPFEPAELVARLEALLRRVSTSTKGPDTFRFGTTVIDFRSTEVRRDNQRVELSAREFALLRYFVLQHGATITRSQLLKEVWGYESAIFTRTVDVHVGLLRQKLEEDPKNPRHFLTVRGLGYKFIPNPQ